MPGGATEELSRELPRLLVLAYGFAGLVVLCGCIGMAVWYLRGRREGQARRGPRICVRGLE